MNKNEYFGSCHCGDITFKFYSSESVEIWKCNCSICAQLNYEHLFIKHEDSQNHLFAAYSAITLNQWFKNQATKILLKNRRYLGLSFAAPLTPNFIWRRLFISSWTVMTSQAWYQIVYFDGSNLLMYAMAITSTDKMVRRLGIKNCRSAQSFA